MINTESSSWTEVEMIRPGPRLYRRTAVHRLATVIAYCVSFSARGVPLMLRPVLLVIVLASLPIACGDELDHEAIAVVAVAIDTDNKLTIARADLGTVPNPKGAGTIVYATQGQPAVWVVVQGAAYAMNPPAKVVTPHVRMAREAPSEIWATTKLDATDVDELLRLVGRSN
jgi:hypothetical protein